MLHLLFAFALTSLFAADKTVCKPRELRGQDCRLSVGSHHIRLLKDTVAREVGAAHVVDPMPLQGDWEKIVFEVSHNRPVLQLWIWDNGKGEAPVQSLHWYTADARPGALKIVAEDVVRRRRLKPPEDEKKKSYLYDAWEQHSLKILKDGQYEWTLGSRKRVIDPNVAFVPPPAPADHSGAPAAQQKGH